MTLVQFIIFLDTFIFFDEYPSIRIKTIKDLLIITGKYGFFILNSKIINNYIKSPDFNKTFPNFKSFIKQLFYGIEHTYSIVLLIKGIGFRFELKRLKNKRNIFKLRAGYHLPITFKYNESVFKINSPKPTRLILKSNNWQKLYFFSKLIKQYRIPDNYKNKGIVYRYEKLIKKQVQKTK